MNSCMLWFSVRHELVEIEEMCFKGIPYGSMETSNDWKILLTWIQIWNRMNDLNSDDSEQSMCNAEHELV